MSNVLLARLAQLPLIFIQLAYAYFFVKCICFSLPRSSFGWLVGWAGMVALFLVGMLGQDFVYRTIRGCVCARDDQTVSFLMGISGAWVSIVMIWYAARRRRQSVGRQ